MRVLAVLFDLDGTLVEFKVDYALGRRMILQFARDNGFDMEGQTEGRSMHAIIDHYREIGDGRAHRAVRKFAYDLMEKLEVEAAHRTSPFPDTFPALNEVKRNGIKTAIVTNSSSKAVEVVFHRFPLRKYFDVVTTRDDVESLKPDAGILKFSLGKLQVKGEDSVFVGDAPGDVQAARAAGVVSVGIPRGSASKETLLAAGPDYVITTLKAIPELLESLKAQKKRKQI